MTLAEEVRRTNDVPIVHVSHVQWPSAYVRPMSVKALGEFRKLAAPEDTPDDVTFEMTLHLMAFLTAHCLCDNEGARVFGNEDIGWIEENKTAELLEPIANAAMELHGLTEDEDRAKN